MWHFKPEEKISGVELRKRLKLNTMMKLQNGLQRFGCLERIKSCKLNCGDILVGKWSRKT